MAIKIIFLECIIGVIMKNTFFKSESTYLNEQDNSDTPNIDLTDEEFYFNLEKIDKTRSYSVEMDEIAVINPDGCLVFTIANNSIVATEFHKNINSFYTLGVAACLAVYGELGNLKLLAHITPENSIASVIDIIHKDIFKTSTVNSSALLIFGGTHNLQNDLELTQLKTRVINNDSSYYDEDEFLNIFPGNDGIKVYQCSTERDLKIYFQPLGSQSDPILLGQIAEKDIEGFLQRLTIQVQISHGNTGNIVDQKTNSDNSAPIEDESIPTNDKKRKRTQEQETRKKLRPNSFLFDYDIYNEESDEDNMLNQGHNKFKK